jgi:hypothetical protein
MSMISPARQTQKSAGSRKVSYIKTNYKKKQDTTTGKTPVAVVMTATFSLHLIPEAMAGVIGLFHVLQDHVHRPQDVTGRTRIPRDSEDGRQAQIL